MADVKWLGADFEDRLFFASNYFQQMYECAVLLIKKGKAFVCDLTADQIREYRGDFTTPGKESPYRNRSIEENLKLFEEMKEEASAPKEKKAKAEPKVPASSPSPALTPSAPASAPATGNADTFVGQPCPVCGKGTIIKGKTAYGCSEWRNGCTYRKNFE